MGEGLYANPRRCFAHFQVPALFWKAYCPSGSASADGDQVTEVYSRTLGGGTRGSVVG
jgi:hypothetical protein